MKPTLALVGLTLSVCALAGAQEGNRVTVPARNTSHPRVVNATTHNGSITVKTYNGKEVIVEAPSGERRGRPDRVDGMRRLDVPRGLDVEEDDNVITIRTSMLAEDRLEITVPVDTSLNLTAHNGPIEIDGVHGEISATSHNGRITMTNVGGTVVASSANGPVTVGMSSVDPTKPMSFSSYNGRVDVSLPSDVKASLTVRTDHGPVYSDFDVTLGGTRSLTEKNNSSDGRFRIRIDNTIIGTINGGGTPINVRTYNGGVYIRKK